MRQEEMYNEMNEQQWIARQEEMLSGEQQFLGSKKEIIEAARKKAVEIIDDSTGSEDVHKRYSSIRRLKEYIDTFESEFRSSISEMKDAEFECYGMHFKKSAGRNVPDYSVDEVWSDLKQQLKDREDILKVATKSKQTIYDDDGVEVPKCPYKASKEYVTIKF